MEKGETFVKNVIFFVNTYDIERIIITNGLDFGIKGQKKA